MIGSGLEALGFAIQLRAVGCRGLRDHRSTRVLEHHRQLYVRGVTVGLELSFSSGLQGSITLLDLGSRSAGLSR